MATTVFVPFLNRSYNVNPKGSSTVEVTMASRMPFDRPVSITQAANVPVSQPMEIMSGTPAAQVAHTRAKHLRRQPIVSANVSGIGGYVDAPGYQGVGADAAPAPAASSWTDILTGAAKSATAAAGERAAAAIAKKPKAPAKTKLPKFIANVPKTNWVIVGVAAVVALGGGWMLMRGKGGSRRRR